MPSPQRIKVRIKENSFRARIACFNLRSQRVAMVWGYTILLHNVTKQEFLNDKAWLCHELRHVWQVHKMGTLRFLWRYVMLSFKYGYRNHPYEVDARRHEVDESLLQYVDFV